MSFNGTGTFQVNSAGQPVVPSTVITSTAFNLLTADLANGLSTAICRDGQTTTTASIPFALGASFAAATSFTSITGLSAAFNGGGGSAGTTILGARSGNAAGSAIDGYQLAATGNAFRAQVDQVTAHLVDFFFSTNAVGSITTDNTSTAYNTSSDARLKDNIKDADISAAWAVIKALRVRSYDWISTGQHEDFGLVAQEEFPVAPFAVQKGDDHPTNISNQWGRDDTKLVPALLLVVQDLEARLVAAGI